MEALQEQVGTTEHLRLAALHRLDLLDTAPEPEFDELVELAAAICETPIGMVALVDEHRQWFKAAIGIEAGSTSRDIAFCHYTIQSRDVMLIEDATADARLAANPLVTGESHYRFYAGMPIFSPDGYAVGTLCVLDRVPRTLTPAQVDALRMLGHRVNGRLELRLERIRLRSALAAAEDARAQLAISENRFQVFMDSAPLLSYLKDADGRFIFYNRAVAEKFGITRQEWIGKTEADLFPADIASQYRTHDREVLQANQLRIVDETSRQNDGSIVRWRSYKFPCTDGDRKFLGGLSLDITEDLEKEARLNRYQLELEAANLKLHELATTDPLTGLANRRVFADRLSADFSHARRKGRDLAVLLLDVDNFKDRNDRFGHKEGDACLCQIAQILEDSIRATDLAVRYGGEEFILLLPETDEEQATQLGERILATIRSAAWSCAPVTLSGGVASLSATTASELQIVSLADEALYIAKRAGKDQIVGSTQSWKGAVAAFAT